MAVLLKEKFVMQLLQYKLEFSIPKLEKFGKFRPFLLITVEAFLCQLFFYVIQQHYFTTFLLRNMVLQLLFLAILIFSASVLATQLMTRKENGMVYNRMLEIGVSMNSTITQQKDWVLLILGSIYLLVVLYAFGSFYFYWEGVDRAMCLVIIPICNEFVSLVTKKYLISKRLRYIRSADEYLDRIEDTISHTRQLLDCNTELNKDFQLVGTTYVIYLFMLVQCICYTMYSIYEVGIEIPGAPENNLFLLFSSYWSMFTMAILMVWSSTLISDEVDECKLEMDATWTARPCNEIQKKKISLFLTELQKTRTELSAMGLFYINRGSFALGCCFIISYLLVLIQFT